MRAEGQYPDSPQQPQLCQQRGVLLGFLRGGLGSLLVLQAETLNLLQDLSREDGRQRWLQSASQLALIPVEVLSLVVPPLPLLF